MKKRKKLILMLFKVKLIDWKLSLQKFVFR